MNIIIDEINELLGLSFAHKPTRIEQLPRSGSDRIYFRVFLNNESLIATHNLNIKENETFLAFSRHFRSQCLPVPEILSVNESRTAYLQQDLGTISLLDKLEEQGRTAYVFELYKKSLRKLASLQIKGH